MGLYASAYPFLFWWLWEYLYFILISTSNLKHELLAIVYGSGMKQWHALYALLCSFLTLFFFFSFLFFLKLIVAYRLCVIYVRKYNDFNV